MKAHVVMLVGLLVPLSPSHAADMPCVAARDEILTNVTEDQGCDAGVYRAHCSKLSKCIRKYRICVLSNDKWLGGNTASEVRANGKSITFGTHQTVAAKNPGYCVMASLNSAPGEESPAWVYRIYNAKGRAIQEDIIESTGEANSFNEFLKKTEKIMSDHAISKRN